MEKERLDALLLTDPPHVRFFSGFKGSTALLFITRRSALLITDGRYCGESRSVQHVAVHIAKRSLFEALGKKVHLPPGSVVGIHERHASFADVQAMKFHLPGMKVRTAAKLIGSVTSVRSRRDLASQSTAVKLSEFVFGEILDMLRPGVREDEIAAEITYLHRRFGAERDAFEPIVASGPRSTLPHACPRGRKLRRGDLVVIDFGCVVGGFTSDIARTVSIGRPSRRVREMYDAVLEAQSRAIEAVADGVPGKEVDRAARDLLTSRGYGREFIHAAGHGLGIEVHEPPRISPRSNDILARGNVIAIEPGVYLPRVGGIRLEDDLIVTRSGAALLTRLPREMIIV